MFEPIIQPGDKIEAGIVETNHCGLPWPVYIDGSQLYGTICVKANQNNEGKYHIFCDAITGEELTEAQIEERLSNEDFDYYRKLGINRDELLVDGVPQQYKIWSK